MVYDEEGFALVLELQQELEDGLLGGGIDAGKGLVHQIEVGLLRQRAGDEHPLLLPAGELGYLPVGKFFHAHLPQGPIRHFPVCFCQATEKVLRAVAPHERHVFYEGGEIPVYALPLRHVAHLPAHLVERLVEHADVPSADLRQPHDALEQGRFTRSVGTGNADQFALGEGEIDVPKHGTTLVAHRQVVGFNGWSAGHSFRLSFERSCLRWRAPSLCMRPPAFPPLPSRRNTTCRRCAPDGRV